MTSENKVLRLGIIGAGRVTSHHHLPALAKTSEVEVVALADVDPARLAPLAGKYGIVFQFDSFRALIDQPGVDAVAVCTPPQFHAEMAVAALNAGKHVFIEKPLALSLADCDAVIAAAGANKVRTTVGFNLRGHRLMRQAQALVESGILGAVQAARVVYTSGFRHREQAPGWRNDLQTGGGVILEVGSHGFDLLRYLLQTEFTEIYALQQGEGRASSVVTIAGRMTNDVQISALFADQTGDALEVDVYGSEGRLHVSGHRFDGLEFYPVSSYPGSVKVRLQKLAATAQALPTGLRVMRQGGDFAGSYQTEWTSFASSILHVQRLIPKLEDGRASLQAALAATRSAQQGEPVLLSEITA